MAKEFLQKYFINEAKAAINRWSNIGGSGGTIPAPGGLVEIDVFPERELIFWGGGDDIYIDEMEPMFILEEGQTYHVSVDGVSYSCVARKIVTEYEDGGSGIVVELGWIYEDNDSVNYSHPFNIYTWTEIHGGQPYSVWGMALQGADDSGEPLPHTIRIYKECKADEVASISTEFAIPTQNHYNGMILYEEPLRLDIGWTYTVSVMGQTYECRCDIEPEYGYLYLGNPLLAGGTPNEGDGQYPFFMANLNMGDGSTAIGVAIDPYNFPVGEDIHVICHFKDIGEVRLENATITEDGTHYPSDGYDGFTSVTVSGIGSDGTLISIAAGLYTDYSFSTIATSWQDLLDAGLIHVDNGVAYTNFDVNNWKNDSSDSLVGVLVFPDDGTVTQLGDFYESEYSGRRAFQLCNQLTGIYIPSCITSICDYAFNFCTAMKKVTFAKNSSLKSIGNYAFSSAQSLTGIAIPASVASIGDSAFSEITELISVTFERGSQLSEPNPSTFFNCPNLREVKLSDGLITIGDNMFNMCPSLMEIEIPANVTNIGAFAFSNCTGLMNVDLSKNKCLETIGEGAFNDCSNLTTIVISTVTPPKLNKYGVFNRVDSITAIRVPAGATNAYIAAEGWNNYADKIGRSYITIRNN